MNALLKDYGHYVFCDDESPNSRLFDVFENGGS